MKYAKMDYDAADRTPYTLEDARPLMGKRAKLTLTGTLIDCGQSDAGTYVKFRVDKRFDLGEQVLVMDLDPFEVES